VPIRPEAVITVARDQGRLKITVEPQTNRQLALEDLADGVASIHIWQALGWQEVIQRYRRSYLGPFWLTLSTGIMVGVMGPLYSKLFKLDMASYFPYLAVSMVLWQTISQVAQDSSNVFIAAEGYIKQVKLPYSVYVLRLVWKNLIVLMHNLVIVLLVILYFRPPLGYALFLFPIALFLFAANAVWVGIVLGMVCARFRDMPLIVTSLMQVAFFLTPIMWQPQMLGRYRWVVNLNPLYHVLETMRAPLTGTAIEPIPWIFVPCMTVLGYVLMFAFYSRFRARIAYWI